MLTDKTKSQLILRILHSILCYIIYSILLYMIVYLHCNMVTNKTKKKLIIKSQGFRKTDLAVKFFIIKAKDGLLISLTFFIMFMFIVLLPSVSVLRLGEMASTLLQAIADKV